MISSSTNGLSNPRVVNLVATAELGQPVDLKRLASEPGFHYDLRVYNCAYLRDSGTVATISIFASGKMISTGTKTSKGAKHDLTYASLRLASLGLIKFVRTRIKVQNIVATAEIGASIDMARLVDKYNVIYEPEQFPGAIYYAPELEGASILVFSNGKVVLAGLKNEGLLSLASHVLAELALSAIGV